MRRPQGKILAGLFAAALFAAGAVAATEAPDMVVSLAGDRIGGRVVSIGKDGLLRMTNPNAEGQIALRVAGLLRATFTPSVEEPALHTVRLAGGGVLTGKVLVISPTEVVVETRVAGRITINRAFVEEIRLAAVRSGPPRTDFSAGEMEPFKDVSGNAAAPFEEGGNGPVKLAAEYPQEKAVTVLMDFVEGCPSFTVSIFVGDLRNPNMNSLRLQWSGEGLSFNANSNNGGWGCGLGQVQGKDGLRSARLCYDPAKRETLLWINDQKSWLPPGVAGPATGKYIMIICPGRMAVSRIQVFDGILGPGEGEKGTSGGLKTADRDAIILANGDTLGAENITLADGVISIKSDVADLAIPVERMGAIIFRQSARKTPEADPKAVLVRTGRSSFILDAVELNDASVIGACPALGGEVRIARAAVKLIRFSVAPPPPKAAESLSPQLPTRRHNIRLQAR